MEPKDPAKAARVINNHNTQIYIIGNPNNFPPSQTDTKKIPFQMDSLPIEEALKVRDAEKLNNLTDSMTTPHFKMPQQAIPDQSEPGTPRSQKTQDPLQRSTSIIKGEKSGFLGRISMPTDNV